MAPATIARKIARDDDSDIIDGAALQGQRDKRVAGALRRLVPRDFEDFRVADMGRQAIAANDENIAFFQDALGDFGVEFIVDADGAGNHIAARPGFRSFRAQNAFRNKFRHFAVIARHLRDPAVTHKVDPAVACPETGISPFMREQGRERRAYSDAMLVGDAQQSLIGFREPVLAAGAKIGEGGGLAYGLQGIDDGRAGKSTRLKPAHAVSDRPDPAFRQDEIGIFIFQPQLADIGGGPALEFAHVIVHDLGSASSQLESQRLTTFDS